MNKLTKTFLLFFFQKKLLYDNNGVNICFKRTKVFWKLEFLEFIQID